MEAVEFVFPALVEGRPPLLQALPELARQGARSLEWVVGEPAFFDDSDAGQVHALKQALQATDIRVASLHAPFGDAVDLSSPEDTVRDVALRAHRSALRFAAEVGARALVVHPGAELRGASAEQRLERAAEALASLEPAARDAGVVMAVENLPPGWPGARAPEVLGVIDAVGSPWVRVCLDVGHAHAAGEALRIARTLMPHVVTMHLHDNRGRQDEHLFPGEGTLDWAAFARAYREARCTAPALLECAPLAGWTWERCARRVAALMPGY